MFTEMRTYRSTETKLRAQSTKANTVSSNRRLLLHYILHTSVIFKSRLIQKITNRILSNSTDRLHENLIFCKH